MATGLGRTMKFKTGLSHLSQFNSCSDGRGKESTKTESEPEMTETEITGTEPERMTQRETTVGSGPQSRRRDTEET